MSASCVLLSVYEGSTSWRIKVCFMAVCTEEIGMKVFVAMGFFSIGLFYCINNFFLVCVEENERRKPAVLVVFHY